MVRLERKAVSSDLDTKLVACRHDTGPARWRSILCSIVLGRAPYMFLKKASKASMYTGLFS